MALENLITKKVTVYFFHFYLHVLFSLRNKKIITIILKSRRKKFGTSHLEYLFLELLSTCLTMHVYIKFHSFWSTNLKHQKKFIVYKKDKKNSMIVTNYFKGCEINHLIDKKKLYFCERKSKKCILSTPPKFLYQTFCYSVKKRKKRLWLEF